MAVEKIFVDFGDEKKVSVIKEKARQVLTDAFMEFLKERTEMAKLVGSNEIGVVVGQAKDQDGFASDVVVVVKATVKPWYDKTDLARPVHRYDLEDEAEAYEAEVKAKKAPKK